MRFRDYLNEAAGDTVGVMYGRFNPPHRGHKAAWELASENTHWYVGTNQSTQGKKDPLPYDTKIKAMEALMPEVAAHIVPETNLFTLASKVYAQHGKVNLFVYTDEDWLTKTLEKYNGEEGKHGYYEFESIAQKPTPRLSSATDVRNAVIADDRAAFEKAAGVPADLKIDGKEYFDLVAEYLLPHHTKESKIDKYNKDPKLKESEMNINYLRKMAGLPLMEGAPVQYNKVGQHGMSKQELMIADIGRLLMRDAESTKDEALSNAMALLGSNLADGSVSTQEDLVGLIKDVEPEMQASLSNAVTKSMKDYAAGERAVGLKPGESPEDDMEVDVDEPKRTEEGNELTDLRKRAGLYNEDEDYEDEDYDDYEDEKLATDDYEDDYPTPTTSAPDDGIGHLEQFASLPLSSMSKEEIANSIDDVAHEIYYNYDQWTDEEDERVARLLDAIGDALVDDKGHYVDDTWYGPGSKQELSDADVQGLIQVQAEVKAALPELGKSTEESVDLSDIRDEYAVNEELDEAEDRDMELVDALKSMQKKVNEISGTVEHFEIRQKHDELNELSEKLYQVYQEINNLIRNTGSESYTEEAVEEDNEETQAAQLRQLAGM